MIMRYFINRTPGPQYSVMLFY